ncbi:MAG: glycoside hydrolase family 3 C-terminal domain-containing protein [Clostridiales bacterium]|nr:glycoside hydrolase family 3 C-terminal domain-containing protein [Clostridiales bacterium]
MKKTMSKRKSIPCLVLIAILVIALIVGNFYALKYAPIITTYLGQTSYTVKEGDTTENTEYFEYLFSSEDERLQADAAAATEASGEGTVLLKNEDNALPMTGSESVTLFGVASADILYGGGGSGAVDTTTAPTLKTALEASGFTVNEVMWDFYTTGAAADIRMDVADIAGTGRYVIHEASTDLLTDTETDSFAEYGDAAIVVFARSGSESSDVPVAYDESYLETMDIEGYYGTVHSEGLDSEEDLGRSYLELTKNEEDLLSYVSSQFDKVIVIINSGNAMELSFLDEEAYGVDACLWIGNPGQDGLYALGEILNGNINPSGHLVDTYAYDSTGAPAVQNFGNAVMTNAETEWYSTYVVYQEGIYVGYKYYETRYEDVVMGQGNADASVGVTAEGNDTWVYADEVQFPFGYGLSYTTFTQELVSSSYEDGLFTFEVAVTNTGDVAGKDVVQLYLQSPYTDYDKTAGVEKASVQLVGFGKTDTIQPGETATLAITVEEEELKAYDSTANNGEGTYILEAGDYYFTAATDAHNAVNNILAAKGYTDLDGEYSAANAVSFAVESTETYSVSTDTGYAITNQFTDADMQTYDESFTYLTRSDWEGTYPQTYQVVATDEMIAALAIAEGTDDPDAEMPTTGADNGLTLAMMRDVDADDPLWDDLLDQLTAEEMYNLVRVGGYQTQAVNSVSAPATVCVDGPAYVGNAGTTGVNVVESTYAWCSEVVLASTWNVEILETMGTLIGQDCLAQGELNFVGWYAPSMNIHRTAFSGRNFEYYSEDGFLSGQMGAATVRGATSQGVICFIKHFALNDQETNRTTINTFANEQSIREIYLKPFETSITDGGALGVMASMNRVGLTWSGDHYGLMTEVLRNEWGFDGVLITDQASYPEAFPALAIRGGLEGGVDLWLNSGTDNWQIEGYESNATVMTELRTASKHILYAVSRSAAMNGISSSATVEQTLPLWEYWLIALDVVVGVAALAGVIVLVRKTQWKKPE